MTKMYKASQWGLTIEVVDVEDAVARPVMAGERWFHTFEDARYWLVGYLQDEISALEILLNGRSTLQVVKDYKES